MKLLTKVFSSVLISLIGSSVIANPVTRLDVDTVALPFADDFTSGVFSTSGWITSSDSWHINTLTGNILPCVEFQPANSLLNYEETLTSAWIDGTSVTDCRIYVDFDFRLLDAMITGNERLIVEIYNDTVWDQVFEFRSTGSTAWDYKHLNITTFSRSKIFKLRFRATGENSYNIVSWQIDNINVQMVCERPTDAYINLAINGNDVHWTAPGGVIPEIWKHWDDGSNAGNGIGLTAGGTFDAAIRFTPEQLEFFGYFDAGIRKIKFFPYQGNGPIVLKVWQGDNPPQLIYSQPVESYTIGQWNVCDIDSLFYIDITRELWVGYQITHQSGLYPAGTDAGPAVAGYGDMISTDGVTWDPMSTFDLNFNWNIQVSIGEFPGPDTCFPLGYQVYRDYEYMATTTNTHYLDTDDDDTHCYKINAFYNDGTSSFSNEACIWVDVDKIDLNSVSLNPNPASDKVTMQLVKGIERIVILDLTGRISGQYSIDPSQEEYVIDVSNFKPGVYLVRFLTPTSSVERKLIIQ